ncbi:MAG: hypothetical protein QXP80_05015 [Zestosphaera sp.]
MEEASSGLKRHQVLIGVIIFALWTILLPLVNRGDVRILGIPLLWFYYITISIITATVLSVMYLLEG